MPVTPALASGRTEVTAQIGQGGMGEVYRARDTKLDRDVALGGHGNALSWPRHQPPLHAAFGNQMPPKRHIIDCSRQPPGRAMRWSHEGNCGLRNSLGNPRYEEIKVDAR